MKIWVWRVNFQRFFEKKKRKTLKINAPNSFFQNEPKFFYIILDFFNKFLTTRTKRFRFKTASKLLHPIERCYWYLKQKCKIKQPLTFDREFRKVSHTHFWSLFVTYSAWNVTVNSPPKDMDVPPKIRTDIRSKCLTRKCFTSAENIFICGLRA